MFLAGSVYQHRPPQNPKKKITLCRTCFEQRIRQETYFYVYRGEVRVDGRRYKKPYRKDIWDS